MMTRTKTLLGRWSLALAAAVAAMSMNKLPVTDDGSAFTRAYAVVGRPATPLSYSGVARRTTRRDYAAEGGAGRQCTRVADGYGRVVTRCY
jgi:hypothetical protein